MDTRHLYAHKYGKRRCNVPQSPLAALAPASTEGLGGEEAGPKERIGKNRRQLT